MLKIIEDDNKMMWFINISMVIIIVLFAVGTTISVMRLIESQNTINECTNDVGEIDVED